jgi:microfibrillar-associated protein 1
MASTFTARDLALALPDKAGDIISLRHTSGIEAGTDAYEPLKPKIDASKKVIRYFPGQAPKWTNDDTESVVFGKSSSSQIVKEEVSSSSSAGVIDRRLARLAAVSKTAADTDDRGRRRRVYDAEIIEEADNTKDDNDDYVEALRGNVEEEDEDDEDINARRNRIRQRLAAKQHEEDETSRKPQLVTDSVQKRNVPEPESEGESEYETATESDSSEEERIVMRPVFVPKSNRQTIREREAVEEAELHKEAQHEEKLEKRKQQTKELLANSLHRKDEERQMALDATDNDSDAGIPDDIDDLEDETEVQSLNMFVIMITMLFQ